MGSIIGMPMQKHKLAKDGVDGVQLRTSLSVGHLVLAPIIFFKTNWHFVDDVDYITISLRRTFFLIPN